MSMQRSGSWVLVALSLLSILLLRKVQYHASWTHFGVLFLIQCICWLVYTYEIYPRYISSFRNLPRVKGGYPVFGYGFAQFVHPRGQRFLNWMKMIPNDGLIYFQGFWHADQLLLTGPRALSEVLVRRASAFTKPPAGADLIRRGIGDSLFVAEFEEHRRLRRILQPFFAYRPIQDMYPIFWKKALELTVAAQRHGSFSLEEKRIVTVEILSLADKVTLDTIGLAALGKDLHTLTRPHDLAQAAAAANPTTLGIQVVFIATALFLPWWILRVIPGGVQKRLNRAGEKGLRICAEFVKERKLEDEGFEHTDIFRRLIDSQIFSDQELVDNLRMIIATGHDPTAATFVWVLHYLAVHPAWQNVLRQEIQANIASGLFTEAENGFDVGETLDRLPILNAICNETLRFMPTTPVTARVAATDTMILETFVPKNTKILIAPYAINRSEEYYGPTAETFDPARWLDEDGKCNNHGGATDNYAFSTFLHGPRRCLGMLYAKAEIRAFVAAFVGRFEFEMAEPDKNVLQVGMFSTRPRDGLKLKLRSIERWW